MVDTSTNVCWTVIAKLQDELAHVNPGSDREQILERAMDLALGGSRREQNPDRLYWDVLRNAKYVFYRSRQRRQAAWARYNGQYDIVFTEEGADLKESGPAVEDEVEGNALWRHLKEGAVQLGSFGTSFLEKLLESERPAEAALVTGISRATAYRSVARLRSQIGPWIDEAA